MISRRAFLSMGLLAASAGRAQTTLTTLRFLRVRHRTLLVEIGGRRVLIDPCFAPGLGAGALFTTADPAVAPEEIGHVDILCVTSSDPGAFDAASTRRLRDRAAYCLVGDASVAKVLRHQGYRRVREVVGGDVFDVRGVKISMSPSRAMFGGAAVGFHLAAGGRSLWHAGAPRPLDVEGEPAGFARAHPAEVVAVAAQGLSAGDVALTLDDDDAWLLAALAKARYLVRLHDDVSLSPLGALVLRAAPAVREAPPGRGARVVVVEAGVWTRVGQRE